MLHHETPNLRSERFEARATDAAGRAVGGPRPPTRLAEVSNELVASEEWDRRFAHAVDPVNHTVDRAFRRGLVLIAVLVGGLGLMLLVVGVVFRRLFLAPSRRAKAA